MKHFTFIILATLFFYINLFAQQTNNEVFSQELLNEKAIYKINKSSEKGSDEKLNILFKNNLIPWNAINVSIDVLQKDSFYYALGSYPNNPFITKFNFSGSIILQKSNNYYNQPASLHYHTSNKLIELANGDQAYLYAEIYIDTLHFHNRHIPVIKLIDDNLNTKLSYYWDDTIDFYPLGGVVADKNKGFTYCGQLASRSMNWVQHSPTEGYWVQDSTYLGIVSLDSNLSLSRISKYFFRIPNCNTEMFLVEDLEKAHDGGYIVGGHIGDCGGINGWASSKSFVVKFDSLLNHQWTKVFEDSMANDDSPINIVPSNYGKTYIYTRQHTKTLSIAYGKFDDNGNILWEKYFNKTMDTNELAGVLTIFDRPHGVIEKDNGDIIFGSRINWNRATGLVRTDSMGNVKWSRVISTKYNENNSLYYSYVFNVKNPIGEGALLVGRVHTMGAFLIRTDSLGCTLPNCIDTNLHVSLEEIVEMQKQQLIVYPNPAQEQVQFAINIQGEKIEEIEIYDLSGKLMISQKPSQFLVNINVSFWSNGMYLVRIRSSINQVFTSKFVKD